MLPSKTQSRVLRPFPSPRPASTTKMLSTSLLLEGHCPLVLSLVLACAVLPEGEDFIKSSM